MNNVMLIGTLLRFTFTNTNGMSIFTATIAGSQEVTTEDGTSKDMVFYQQVEVLGEHAADLAARVNEGDVVFVNGALKSSQWKDKDSGDKRSKLLTYITSLRLIGPAADFETVTDAAGNVRLSKGKNEVRLVGRLAVDAELHYTPTGRAVLHLNVAVNEPYIKDGRRHEATQWVRVQVWGDLAEQYAELKKGDSIMALGHLRLESWQKDGVKRSMNRLVATQLYAFPRQATASRSLAAAS